MELKTILTIFIAFINMIKTKQKVSYNPINLDLKDFVFAEVIDTSRNDRTETYTLTIREWIEETFKETVEVDGEMVEQEFTRQRNVRNHKRTMTFAEADNLTNALDQQYTISEKGAARRKRYTILGHLLINNLEKVRNTQWELVE